MPWAGSAIVMNGVFDPTSQAKRRDLMEDAIAELSEPALRKCQREARVSDVLARLLDHTWEAALAAGYQLPGASTGSDA